jgi:hypothetical protein
MAIQILDMQILNTFKIRTNSEYEWSDNFNSDDLLKQLHAL